MRRCPAQYLPPKRPVSVLYFNPFSPRPKVTHVVFDFDGTLSLLRQGWPRTMRRMFLELLPPLEGEDRAALERELAREILDFNGRQPIHQMRAFAERVRRRGGRADAPEDYLAEYARRLRAEIDQRIDALRTGARQPDDFVLHGARAFLDQLCQRGMTLYLLSGTREEFVREEARLLGLDEYFSAGIFGGARDPARFSKEMIYDRIMTEAGITGESLLSFGDGPVEMRATLERGGLAVAVCSDETDNGSGRIDPAKLEVLSEAGAHAAIPDYREATALLDRILAA